MSNKPFIMPIKDTKEANNIINKLEHGNIYYFLNFLCIHKKTQQLFLAFTADSDWEYVSNILGTEVIQKPIKQHTTIFKVLKDKKDYKDIVSW